jgi:hypothetical protein
MDYLSECLLLLRRVDYELSLMPIHPMLAFSSTFADFITNNSFSTVYGEGQIDGKFKRANGVNASSSLPSPSTNGENSHFPFSSASPGVCPISYDEMNSLLHSFCLLASKLYYRSGRYDKV